jgi:predicted membrane protein DUF2306
MWTQLNLRSIQEAPQIQREAPQTEVAVAEARLPEVVAVPEIRPAKAIRDTSLGTRILLGCSTVVALWFLNTAALRYLTVSPDSYGIYWPRHYWLFAHVVAGTFALLIGPIQFWPRLHHDHPTLHRYFGITYVSSTIVAAVAAYYLAFHTDFGWMFSMGLASMATAWLISTALASIAIYKKLIKQHREWMIRSYVVTFGFVVFRVSTDMLDVMGVGTFSERLVLASWICWSVPLLLAETILQGRKIFSKTPAAP